GGEGKKKSPAMLLAIGGFVLLAGLGAVVYMMMPSNPTRASSGNNGTAVQPITEFRSPSQEREARLKRENEERNAALLRERSTNQPAQENSTETPAVPANQF